MRLQVRFTRMLALTAVVIACGAAPASAADLAAARKNYDTFCAKCHGDSGQGNGSQAATLGTKPASFADCSAMAKLSDDGIFKAIKDGGKAVGKSPEMPAAGEAFEDSEIRDLVTYVRSFCRK